MSTEPTVTTQSNKKRALVSIEGGQRFYWQLQPRTCGKGCRTCRERGGHGPYWYKSRRVGGKGPRNTYVGKHLPPGIQFLQEGAEEEVSTQDASSQIPTGLVSAARETATSPEPPTMPAVNARTGPRTKYRTSRVTREETHLIPVSAVEELAR